MGQPLAVDCSCDGAQAGLSEQGGRREGDEVLFAIWERSEHPIWGTQSERRCFGDNPFSPTNRVRLPPSSCFHWMAAVVLESRTWFRRLVGNAGELTCRLNPKEFRKATPT